MYPGKYAAETPEKPAAVNAVTGEVLTYRRLNEDSIRLARYLRSVGLKRGDALAINSVSYTHLTLPTIYPV